MTDIVLAVLTRMNTSLHAKELPEFKEAGFNAMSVSTTILHRDALLVTVSVTCLVNTAHSRTLSI